MNWDIYATEFRRTRKARSEVNVEENIKSLSNKYKELYDNIINTNMCENEKYKRLQGLNYVFKCSVESEMSNDAFVAQSNEIHDYLLADFYTGLSINPDKEKYSNILKYKKATVDYLSNLKETLENFADVYYESFINDIKTNSVKDSVKNCFVKMGKEYNDAKNKAAELSKIKTELYKHIDFDTEAFSKNSAEVFTERTNKKTSRFMSFTSTRFNNNMASVLGLGANIYTVKTEV